MFSFTDKQAFRVRRLAIITIGLLAMWIGWFGYKKLILDDDIVPSNWYLAIWYYISMILTVIPLIAGVVLTLVGTLASIVGEVKNFRQRARRVYARRHASIG